MLISFLYYLPVYSPEPGSTETSHIPPQPGSMETSPICPPTTKWRDNLVQPFIMRFVWEDLKQFSSYISRKKKEKSLQSISKPPQIIWQICLNGRKSLRNPDTAWPFCVSFQIWLRSLHCFGHIFATRVFFSESGHVHDFKYIVRDKAVGSQLFTICSALSLGSRKTTSPFP